MIDHPAPRALVIGGSLAGLLTAISLRKIDWRVDVFERSPHALDSRGGGLVLQLPAGTLDQRLRAWELPQLRAGRSLTDWGRRMGAEIMGVAPALH
jgi:2-polyprenyl-6-methoxyphenol hydroxylase-like FAD-dependent oxidoreductase